MNSTYDLAPDVWLHSSVSRAPHRCRESNGFESHWSPDIFQASSFQSLKLENLLPWSLFTFIFFSPYEFNSEYSRRIPQGYIGWPSFWTLIIHDTELLFIWYPDVVWEQRKLFMTRPRTGISGFFWTKVSGQVSYDHRSYERNLSNYV